MAFQCLRSKIECGTLHTDSIKEVNAFGEGLKKLRAVLDQERHTDEHTWEVACEEIYEMMCAAKLFANTST